MQVKRTRRGDFRVVVNLPTTIYHRLYASFGPQDWWPGDTRLEIIVGAILTQNTAWSNVEKAIANLRGAGALSSLAALKNIRTRTLAKLIRPAGYYNIKAKRIKNFLRFLSSRYQGSLKAMSAQETGTLRQELLGVNGIGQETCDSILLYAFRRPIFVVDAYTKRIFSRHGLFAAGASYEDLQDAFMKRLPSDERLFNEYHALIVRLGKLVCRKNPDCSSCPLESVKITCK